MSTDKHTTPLRASRQWFAEVDAYAERVGLSRNAAILTLAKAGLLLLSPEGLAGIAAGIEALRK